MKVVNGVNFTVTAPGHYAYVPGEQPLLVRLSAPTKRERKPRAPRAAKSTGNERTQPSTDDGARADVARLMAGEKVPSRRIGWLKKNGYIHQNADGEWIPSVIAKTNGVRAEA